MHNSFSRFVVSVFFLAGSFFPGVAVAGNEVTFALFTREWPPFEMVVDGKPVGAAVDLFKALMPPDVRTRVELFPSPRSRLRAPVGPVFARLESRKWVKAPDSFLWSDPVMGVKTVLYSPKGNPREYGGDCSLYGLTVGCIKEFIYPEVRHLFAGGLVARYDVNDELILLRMLKAGRVDAALFDDVSVAWMIRNSEEMAPDDFHVARDPLGSENLRFFFNKNEEWRRRLPEINRLIREKRADGVIDAIMDRYR